MIMKISIVIPIYNMESSLETCIESILKQAYRNYEIILVDDGSKDNSLGICKKYAEEYDNIISFHQDNSGSGPARNSGINIATGDYLLFIDSDDELKQDALSILANAVKCSPDLLVFGYQVVYNSGKIINKNYNESCFTGNDVRSDYSSFFGNTFEWGIQGAPWNKLFKTEIVKKNAILFPDLRRHQDEVFISRFVNFVNSVQFIKANLYVHYANDAKLIWKKYPSTYFDIVEQLYNYRKEIILPWNTSNNEIKELIYSEYINNVFRACFRLFDTSNILSYKSRKKWYSDNLKNRFDLKNIIFKSSKLGLIKKIQNSLFLFCIRHNIYFLIDLLVWLRIKSL